VDGVGSVIRNVQSGNILGAILSASNTYNNAKKIKKSAVKEELKGIAKEGILDIGKQAGTITNPVAQFSVGAVAVASAAAIASPRGTADNKNQANTKVITNNTVDFTNFLGPDEVYNLVTNNADVRTEIASGIYYKDIGSRKGLTPNASAVEYEASSDSVKTVYSNKAITDVRKLVTEGFIKIDRDSFDVEVVTEKANI